VTSLEHLGENLLGLESATENEVWDIVKRLVADYRERHGNDWDVCPSCLCRYQKTLPMKRCLQCRKWGE
jgi:hypothetical protein